MEQLKRQLGLRIRQLRKHRQITQEQLAEAADISTDFISRVERGRNIPSLERINAIAKALNISLAEFFLHINPFEKDLFCARRNKPVQHDELNKKTELSELAHRSIHPNPMTKLKDLKN